MTASDRPRVCPLCHRDLVGDKRAREPFCSPLSECTAWKPGAPPSDIERPTFINLHRETA